MRTIKKNIIFTFFLFFLVAVTGMCNEKKTILFLPFMNIGNYRLDRLKTHIPNFLYLAVKNSPEINAVPYTAIHAYMVENMITGEDLNRYSIIEKLGRAFHAEYVFYGYFLGNDNMISITFITYKKTGEEYVPSYEIIDVELGDTNVLTLTDSLDNLIPVCERVIETTLDIGHLLVVTNPACRLLIDGEEMGRTPLRLACSPGDHSVKIMYDSKEVIFDRVVNIEKNNSQKLEIEVFVPLNIKAGEQCTIYINDIERGTTPFNENLFWGRIYQVKVIYYGKNGIEQNVYEGEVNTEEPVPPYYFSAKAEVFLDFPGRFSACFGNRQFTILPYSFTDVIPGNYRLRVLLDDPEWKRHWLYTDRIILVSPFERVVFNRESISFKNNWALLFVPSALQFHNRQPAKGTVLLTTFLATAAATAVFAGYWQYWAGEYNGWMEKRELSEFDPQKADKANTNMNGFFQLFIGGIVTGAAIYIYSGIDGIVTMNHIHKLVYKD